MTSKLGLVRALRCLAVAAAALCGVVTSAFADNPIKVGFSVALTGAVAQTASRC